MITDLGASLLARGFRQLATGNAEPDVYAAPDGVVCWYDGSPIMGSEVPSEDWETLRDIVARNPGTRFYAPSEPKADRDTIERLRKVLGQCERALQAAAKGELDPIVGFAVTENVRSELAARAEGGVSK